jgi:glycosyltransferase involved in cell wall biosynthesis
MEKVSVIIPVYNRAAQAREAIASVLAQTVSEFEILLIDDGSTDGTNALKGSDQRIRYYYQENKGASSARNLGIRAATGTHIAFLDSDDLWLPKKLEKEIRFFKEHPDFSIVQTEEIWIRNGVRVNPGKKHQKRAGWIFRECLPLCLISPSTVMIRREVFEAAGLFDETFPVCEDYDLWLRITPRFQVGLIPEALTVKRGGHPDQLSRVYRGMDRFRIRAIEKALRSEFLTEKDDMAAFEELERKCSIVAGGCLKRGKWEEAEFYRELPNRHRKERGDAVLQTEKNHY